MVAVLANEKSVVILDSPDLKNWTRRSTFGPAGETAGAWECPNFFELSVEGTNEKKWVLIASRTTGAPFGGTGVRYIVGNFDGATFTSEVPDAPELWADWGKDFYATNTWNDAPASPGQRVWIGWFDNWQYANFEPSIPWRGVQTIPRTLALRRYADGLHLVQRPVSQLRSLRQEIFRLKNASVSDTSQKIHKSGTRGEVYELEAELQPGQAEEIGIRLRTDDHVATVVGFTPASREIWIDRTLSGEVSFSKDFPGRHAAQVENNSSIKLHIFVDRSSIELFANDGERVISDRIYPPPGSDGIEFYEKGSGGKVISLTVWKLNSVWK
jgi:fructan beta-fructosidase